MSDEPEPPADQPWWKGWWRKLYLVSIGLTVGLTLAVALLVERRRDRAVLSSLGMVWLILLGELGVGIAICDRDFWRPTSPAMNFLLTLVLLFLSVVAMVGLIWIAIVACMVVIGGYSL